MSNISNLAYITHEIRCDRIYDTADIEIYSIRRDVGCKWDYEGKAKAFYFQKTGSFCQLRKKDGIAIVDIDKFNIGKAFIINGDGEIVNHITAPKDIYFPANFFTTYYDADELSFFFNKNFLDFKLSYDELTNSIIKCIYVRYSLEYFLILVLSMIV